MNKENIKKIEELKKKRDDLYNEMLDINHQITEIELSEYNQYEGKFIYYKDYGYMYVTWQKYEKSSQLYKDKKMFLQGYAFNGESSSYRDAFWLQLDALKEWYIPIDRFLNDAKNGEIKEISQEEYINEMHKVINEISTSADDMLTQSINYYKENI